MYCSVCQRDTAPIKISGDNYCSNCGTRYATTPAPAKSAGPALIHTRRMTDLAPRRPGSAPPPPTAESPANDQHASNSPVTTPIRHPAAAALHSRIKPSHALDLRAHPAAAAPSPQVHPEIKRHAESLPATAPKSTTHERHLAHLADKLSQAKQYDRSPSVSRFGNRPAPPANPAPTTRQSTPVHHHNAGHHVAQIQNPSSHPNTVLPPHTATQHQAMARLISPQHSRPVHEPHAQTNQTTPPHTQTPKPHAQASGRTWRPHLKLSPHTSRVMAVTAAVGIMAGYVWLQNYPKLALQSASARAGLSASLPSYVPSSYNLTRTDTAPGLVTLHFTSPGAAETLKIAQTRTSWDSSSLLDNAISKTADDYTTVQGQGLTIYLFNNNQATWINHGIRYSIEGAARLSREQILKIAYSL